MRRESNTDSTGTERSSDFEDEMTARQDVTVTVNERQTDKQRVLLSRLPPRLLRLASDRSSVSISFPISFRGAVCLRAAITDPRL